MKRKLIVTLIAAVIIGMITLSIVSRNRNKVPEVSAYTVKTDNFSREISANGDIISRKSIQVVSKVSSVVSEIRVEIGDSVKKGEVLILLDKGKVLSEYRQLTTNLEQIKMGICEELLDLRTSYTQAKVNFEQAERSYKRTVELHKIGSVSDEELRSRKDTYLLAETSFNTAKQRLNFREGKDLDDERMDAILLPADTVVSRSSEVKQAKEQIRQLEENMKDYIITSSMTGVITYLGVEEGGITSPGTVVCEVQDKENMEVKADIDEVDLSYIEVGQSVTIKSDSFIGKELTGKVEAIDPVIREKGEYRVCGIHIGITGGERELARIGASCSIFITVETKENVPSIPVESFFTEHGEKWVYKLQEKEFDDSYILKKQTIKTGILGINNVEVLDGLEAGDLIVSSGHEALEDGGEVKISKDNTEDSE